MILFLFGTWGAGKSTIGRLIEARCRIPHMEADLLFNEEMVAAIHARQFHALDLDSYYRKVITEILSYQRRAPHVVVSQGAYHERYRHRLADRFAPHIAFVWVQTPDEALQKQRLDKRAQNGNPITASIYDYMLPYWESPRLPHATLINDANLDASIGQLLTTLELCNEEPDE